MYFYGDDICVSNTNQLIT